MVLPHLPLQLQRQIKLPPQRLKLNQLPRLHPERLLHHLELQNRALLSHPNQSPFRLQQHPNHQNQ
jgi:hypothetical protein